MGLPVAVTVQTGGALLGPRVVVDGRGGGLFVWVEIPSEGGGFRSWPGATSRTPMGHRTIGMSDLTLEEV